MDRSDEYCTQHNPQECRRAEQSSLYGTENRSETSNVEEMNKVELPSWHWDVVDTVLKPVDRCLNAFVNSRYPFDSLSVNEI